MIDRECPFFRGSDTSPDESRGEVLCESRSESRKGFRRLSCCIVDQFANRRPVVVRLIEGARKAFQITG